jgi:hypothetical protein
MDILLIKSLKILVSQFHSHLTVIFCKMLCPITLEKIKTPVVASDGHIYESTAISRWLETNLTSPITGLVLQSKNLYPLFVNPNNLECLVGSNKLENKAEDSEKHLNEIIKEKTDRLKMLSEQNENFKGVIKYMSEYNPDFEQKLNLAKQTDDKIAKKIQLCVTLIIKNYEDETTVKKFRQELNKILEKENIVQIESNLPFNFTCLPLKGMFIKGTGHFYDFRCSDLRYVIFEGTGSTTGCIHANYSYADMSDSVVLNDFCTKSSKYICTDLSNAVLTTYNNGESDFSGSITLNTKFRKGDKQEKFTCEESVSTPDALNLLTNIKRKLVKK